LAGEEHRHGATDARVAAGHQGGPVLELGAAEIAGRHETGREPEIGFAPGLVEPLRGHVGGLAALTRLGRSGSESGVVLAGFKLALAVLESTPAFDRAGDRVRRPRSGWLACVHAAYS